MIKIKSKSKSMIKSMSMINGSRSRANTDNGYPASMRPLLMLGVLFLATAPAQAADAWPQFRGPGGQGHAASARAPLAWSETDGVAWQVPIPGRGWSSPVVLGKEVWMTTAVTRAGTDLERKAVKVDPAATDQPLSIVSSVSLRAICVDRGTGKIRHDIELLHVDRPEPVHAVNSYASPTPVVELGRIYCHFGAFGTVCLDTVSGSRILWKARFPLKHFVGPGSSPVLVDDLLVLTCDGVDRQYIVAVDKRTGEVVWRKDRPPIRAQNPNLRKSFCTPLAIRTAAGRQIVIPGAQWVVAYEPRTGEEIWRFDHGSGFSIVPRPVFDGVRIYFCTGFMQPRLLAIRPDGTGDLAQTDVVWEERKQIPKVPSPVLVENRLYVVSDSGIAHALDTATGAVVWRHRIPGNYAASLLYAAGRIFAFDRDGVTTVFAHGDAYQELARNRLAGRIMATPAIVDGVMFLRTDTHLYRIEPAP
ncbi:MAG: PQQ-binding-like beta-propeller repeat protein [Planctomycetia bacterium]|nr:MAG: PQQ-binding-like beta-propeller repeat protein [Planctomycetia bacterium]